MRMPMILAGALAATMPIAVDAPDSTYDRAGTPGETRIRLAAGTGRYAFVARGCEGQVISQLPVRYRDAGGSIEQRFENSPVRIGLRGGVLRDEFGVWSGTRAGTQPRVTITNHYLNPYVVLDGGRGATSLGWVAHEREFITAGEFAREQPDHPANDFSASVRVGPEDGRYFAIRWMESVPLYSEGGYLTIGVGEGSPQPGPEWSAGMSAGGPFEGAGVFVRGTRMFDSGLGVTLAGRTGLSEPAAYGATLGIEYRMGGAWARSQRTRPSQEALP